MTALTGIFCQSSFRAGFSFDQHPSDSLYWQRSFALFLSKLELGVQPISTPHNTPHTQTLVESYWLHTLHVQQSAFLSREKNKN